MSYVGANAVLTALRGNNLLTQLDLSRNDLKYAGVKAAVDMLSVVPTLEHLDLRECGFPMTYTEEQELFEPLQCAIEANGGRLTPNGLTTLKGLGNCGLLKPVEYSVGGELKSKVIQIGGHEWVGV